MQKIPSSMIIYDVEQAAVSKCQRHYGKWGLFEHHGYLSTLESELDNDKISSNRWIRFSHRLAKLGIHRDNNQCHQEVIASDMLLKINIQKVYHCSFQLIVHSNFSMTHS